ISPSQPTYHSSPQEDRNPEWPGITVSIKKLTIIPYRHFDTHFRFHVSLCMFFLLMFHVNEENLTLPIANCAGYYHPHTPLDHSGKENKRKERDYKGKLNHRSNSRRHICRKFHSVLEKSYSPQYSIDLFQIEHTLRIRNPTEFPLDIMCLHHDILTPFMAVEGKKNFYTEFAFIVAKLTILARNCPCLECTIQLDMQDTKESNCSGMVQLTRRILVTCLIPAGRGRGAAQLVARTGNAKREFQGTIAFIQCKYSAIFGNILPCVGMRYFSVVPGAVIKGKEVSEELNITFSIQRLNP
ncbi:hypothetical protein STEG23_008252, partial [Scotinomys teguina]